MRVIRTVDWELHTKKTQAFVVVVFIVSSCLVGRLLACLSGLLVVCRCFNNFVCLFCSLCGWLLTCGSLCSSLASLPTHSWTDSKGWVKGQLQALPSRPLSPKPPPSCHTPTTLHPKPPTSCHTPTTTSRPNHPLHITHPQQHHTPNHPLHVTLPPHHTQVTTSPPSQGHSTPPPSPYQGVTSWIPPLPPRRRQREARLTV